MDKKITMILAVVVVVVVIAAGAAVILTNDDDDDGSNDAAIATKLQIRGNANDDYTIDDKDMDLLKEVESGSKTLDECPLADVNGDGKVDSTDEQLLQDLIDRKEGSKAYVICLDRNGDYTTVETTYPLRNVVTYGTNVQFPTLYANGGQYVAGYFSNSYKVGGSALSSAVDLKGETRSISTGSWANFTKLDADLDSKGGIGALIVDYSSINAITDSYESDLDAGKIPMLIFSSADAVSEITTVLTLGFLFGGDCEKMGVTYAQTSEEVLNYIADKTSDLSDDEKTTYIACNMYIYICQNDSTFSTSAVLAGGMPYYKTNSTFAKDYAGSHSTKMTSTEALSNYKDIGCIINVRSMDWGLDPAEYKATVIESWTHDNSGTPSTEFFKGFEDKLAYVDNLLPGAVKVAYMAHALYGDRFGIEYADSVLQKFIDMGTDPLKGQTLDTIVAYIDKAAYERATSTEVVTVGDNAVNIEWSLVQNYDGRFSTNAASEKFAYKAGSDADSSTLTLSSGVTADGMGTSSVNVTIASDAKAAYTNSYAEASALGYTAAKLDSKFYGAYAFYKNDSGNGTLVGQAYIQNVLVKFEVYEPYEIADADVSAFVDALYSAVTGPVEYNGDPIPSGEATGAALVAETLAKDEKFSVSSDTEPTSESAAVVFATKNAMGKDATYTIPIKCGYALASDYKTAVDNVSQKVGTAVSTKNNTGSYAEYTESIGDVDGKIVIGHIDGKSYTYLYFVIKSGNVMIDMSSDKVCIYNTDETALASDVKAFLTQLATAASGASEKGAELVANALVANNGDKWSVPTDAENTESQATVTMAGMSAMGKAKDMSFVIKNATTASSDFTNASTTLDTHNNEAVSSKNNTGSFAQYNGTVDSVDNFKAYYGHIEGKNYSYVYFVMQSGDDIIDCSNEKISFYNKAESELSNDVQAFFNELAAAMNA